jgi:hypothetical protein
MDEKLLAAISAAVQAYIETEREETVVRIGQRLSPWKMAARRETMARRILTQRGNPVRMRLNRYSLI